MLLEVDTPPSVNVRTTIRLRVDTARLALFHFNNSKQLFEVSTKILFQTTQVDSVLLSIGLEQEVRRDYRISATETLSNVVM